MKKLLVLTSMLLALSCAAAQAANIILDWDPNTETDLAGYRLFQSTRSLSSMTTAQALGDATIIKTAVSASTTSTTVSVIENATYYFTLTAYNTSGLESAFSNQVSTFVKDTTSPTISMTAPSNGATVSGTTVTVSATASDNVAVVGVQFKLDGVNLGAEDLASPYSFVWNSTATANGSHTLSAVARDAAGNTTTASVNMTVSNSVSSGGISSMPVISRNKPAFATNTVYPASNGNDADYSTYWMGASASSLIYDLSSVPAANRKQVIAAWYNDPMTSPYDHTFVGEVAYNNLGSYTIDLNAAAGGGSAPTTGWVTVVTVTNNKYHSRQHFFDMTGYNWIRINATASDGSSGNTNVAINFDVHDAHLGANDSWMFIGDSITMDGMHHEPVNGTTGNNYSQLVNAGNSNFFPAAEDAGIGGLTSNEGAANVGTWINTFPGRYMGLSYGTNDANGGSCGTTAANTFYNNYVTMVQAVLAAGKTPVIPTIVASKTSGVQTCGPVLNAKIQTLYTNFPQIVHGPDLWTYFQNNPSLISGDNLHPNAAGYAGMRQQWANTMLTNVYNSTPTSDTTSPTISMTAPTNGSTVSGSAVTISASASDNVGVVGVQFKLDGANIGSEDAASPYSIIWSSTMTTNGSHTLSATARDAAGNMNTASVTVTVSNDLTPPTISAVAAGSITCYVATISWTTNELASSTVTFSTSSSMSPSTQVPVAGLVTSHAISLSGLTANTTYYFRVASADAAGNGSTFNSTFNTHKVGDITGDNLVNIFDLSAMMSHWNATGNSYPAGDFYPLGNPDGNVNIFDLSAMMSNWGQ